MRIIALMNQKGGVGKTTTTANLGAALAEQGQRVCLIDLDPQAHLTINYGVEPSSEIVSLYDVLIEDRSFLEAVHKVDERIALVPSSIDLAGAEIELVSVPGRETLLKRKLEVANQEFDFVLLDCPPSLGLLTINALSVATEVIIPMQPHFLALQGVAKLLETVQLVNRRMNPDLKVSGIVLTMFDAQTKLSSEVVAELNGFIESAKGKPLPWANARVYATKIRRNIKLAECPSFGQTIIKYDPSSNGAWDYRNLARELMGLPPIAPAAPVAKVAAVAKPAAVIVTAKPVAAGPALPPKPVMPAALVAAMKLQAAKQANAPAARLPVATPAKPQAAVARPVSAPPPIPVLELTAPPLPPARAVARPAVPPGTTAVKPAVAVTVSPTIDQSKLAAASAADAKSTADSDAA